jgi:hypothetical protein
MKIRKWMAAFTTTGLIALNGTAAEPTIQPVAPSALTFGTLRSMPAETAKAKVADWLKSINKFDQAKFDAVWAKTDSTLLNLTVESIALGNPEVAKAIATARDAVAAAPTDVPAVIKDEKNPFVKANVACAFAKALAGKRVYEEALKATADIEPEQLVDPSTFFFFKAVAEHSLAGTEGVKGFNATRTGAVMSIVKLLDDVTDAPDRYKMVATLMFFDIQNWAKDKKDLANIAKLMDNSGRRLDLARAGTQTQEIQKNIVFRLDEKIKELENQQKGGGSSNGGSCPSGGSPGPANGTQPSGPADVSTLPQGGGEGKVDDKKLRKYAEDWGKMPADARAKAMQEITKDLPAKYKPMIEEYFKNLNRINGYDK